MLYFVRVKQKFEEYEYDEAMESSYRTSLFKMFNKTLSDGFFPLIIVDAPNHKVGCTCSCTYICIHIHVHAHVYVYMCTSVPFSVCDDIIIYIPGVDISKYAHVGLFILL